MSSNRDSASYDTLNARRQGSALPLVIVSVMAVLTLVSPLFATALFQRQQEQIALETDLYFTTEARIIEEFRREAEAQLMRRDRAIGVYLTHIREIDSERELLRGRILTPNDPQELARLQARERDLAAELASASDALEREIADRQRLVAELERFESELSELDGSAPPDRTEQPPSLTVRQPPVVSISPYDVLLRRGVQVEAPRETGPALEPVAMATDEGNDRAAIAQLQQEIATLRRRLDRHETRDVITLLEQARNDVRSVELALPPLGQSSVGSATLRLSAARRYVEQQEHLSPVFDTLQLLVSELQAERPTLSYQLLGTVSHVDESLLVVERITDARVASGDRIEVRKRRNGELIAVARATVTDTAARRVDAQLFEQLGGADAPAVVDQVYVILSQGR